MNKKQYRIFLNMLMASDPFPGTDIQHKEIERFANKQAKIFGFADWITAYHMMK